MHNKYKGFDNAEEVWFCNIIDNQAGGLRSRTDYPGEPRVCEISDIYLILKKMHIQDKITNRHLLVFTTGAEWMVTGQPLTPESIELSRQTTRI